MGDKKVRNPKVCRLLQINKQKKTKPQNHTKSVKKNHDKIEVGIGLQ